MNRSPVLKNLYRSAEVILFDTEAKYVIFSDLHMGNGSRTDDFRQNSRLCRKVLNDFYLPARYTLILIGDIEELPLSMVSPDLAHERLLILLDPSCIFPDSLDPAVHPAYPLNTMPIP